jgi:hypothetical protein
MHVDLKELLAEPHEIQRRRIATILGQKSSCIIFNAVMTHRQAVDAALLRQLRYFVDVETAVDYHNRSEPVTQQIMARSDSVAVWNEIYNQYIPGIAARVAAGDAPGACTSIMTMLTQVESEY